MAWPTGKRALSIRLIEARARKPFGEIIGDRRAQGQSYRQIGREFGVSSQTVWRHWKQHEDEERAAAQP